MEKHFMSTTTINILMPLLAKKDFWDAVITAKSVTKDLTIEKDICVEKDVVDV